MDVADEAIISHIQRLPDEVLARLFIVGSWLPGQIPKTNYPNANETMHPLRLKPYAKRVSQVCARWRSIVYWQSNRRELYHAAISLRYSASPTNPAEIAPILKAYFDGIVNSEDAELDVEWHFFRIMMPGEPPNISDDLVVPLFLHGMNLTAPHFHRVRSLTAYFAEPEVLAFCFLLLNNLGDDSALTHLKISTSQNLAKFLATLTKPPFMPTCATLSRSPGRSTFHPIPLYSALSHLTLIMPIDIVKTTFDIPSNLLHLSLSDPSDIRSWNTIWAVIRQCGFLRTLAVDLPGPTRLPILSDDLIINLPFLVELTFLHASVRDLVIMLPFLTTPCLKHLHFRGLFGGDMAKTNSRHPASIRAESGNSQHLIHRKFAVPHQLSIRAENQKIFQATIASLFACMSLDAVKQVWVDHAGFEIDKSPNALARILNTLEIRLMVQTILTLCRRYSWRTDDDTMLQVTVTAVNGRPLYRSSDDADTISNHLKVSFRKLSKARSVLTSVA